MIVVVGGKYQRRDVRRVLILFFLAKECVLFSNDLHLFDLFTGVARVVDYQTHDV